MKLICLIIEELGWTARPIHFFHFHQSSLPNGKIDWEMKRNDGQRAPLRLINQMKFIEFDLMEQRWVSCWKDKRKWNELLEWKRRAKLRMMRWVWLAEWLGGLWALQRQWLRPRRANANKQTHQFMNQQRKSIMSEVKIEEERDELVDLLKWNENKDSSSPGMTKSNAAGNQASNTGAASPFFSSTFVGPLKRRQKVDWKEMEEVGRRPSISPQTNQSTNKSMTLNWFVIVDLVLFCGVLRALRCRANSIQSINWFHFVASSPSAIRLVNQFNSSINSLGVERELMGIDWWLRHVYVNYILY